MRKDSSVHRGFYAYPSRPEDIGHTVEAAVTRLKRDHRDIAMSTWRELDVPGRFIAGEVLKEISGSDFLLADISAMNFNVTFEVGYAIGQSKRIILTLNTALEKDQPSRRELGIYDTLGYEVYQNSEELLSILGKVSSLTPLPFNASSINTRAPVYLLNAKYRTDKITRIFARVKKARLFFRAFDPREYGRLSPHEAIQNVAQSVGVLVPLLSSDTNDFNLHNLRAAFLAGLAWGMGKVLFILQDRDDPVPLDYRDLVRPYYQLDQIDPIVAEFAAEVTEALQQGAPTGVKKPKSFLAQLTLGASQAENELKDLAGYYISTNEYLRAERGEVRLVVGRKGSGKTALFLQLRDRKRRDKSNIVLDLKPEGYKLLRFKEELEPLLSAGTLEHTFTAFWEYLLLLEVCYKLLEKDKERHLRDHTLYEAYRRLAQAYAADEYVSEGDFSERTATLVQQISADYVAKVGDDIGVKLSNAQLTDLVYKHDVSRLRQEVHGYLLQKGEVWFLIDNLDKGWPTHGIREDDLVIIRTLLEATRKLEREFSKDNIPAHTIVFLRNDVYELLIGETPDRGKESKAVLDWTDPELLRELVRRRIVFNGLEQTLEFEAVWRQICVSLVDGEESSQYLIERSLMRPRCLIDLIDHCRSHAINLGKQKIEQEDICSGLKAYSADLLVDIGYEIRDVQPQFDDVLYAFIDVSAELGHSDVEYILTQAGVAEGKIDDAITILLWHAFMGLATEEETTLYIYSVNYDMKRLRAILDKRGRSHARFRINPAFWPVLSVHQ